MDIQEKENTSTITSQPTLSPSTQISTQLPILSSDVGETITTKENENVKTKNRTGTSPTPTPKEKNLPAGRQVTPTPTKKDQPAEKTPTPEPTKTETPTMTNTGGLDPEKIFSMSNEYRKSKGLPEFKKDEKTCSLAASRAPEVSAEVASGDMHKGLRDRNLNYWNTENIISMRTEEAAFNWWINDKIHHDAIVGNFTYSCVACSGNSCAQEFTNYQPK